MYNESAKLNNAQKNGRAVHVELESTIFQNELQRIVRKN